MVSIAKYKKGPKGQWGPYREIVLSVRYGPDMVRKIFIKYIRKNEKANLHLLKTFHANEYHGEVHERIEAIKDDIRTLSDDDLFVDSNKQELSQEEYRHALQEEIARRGNLNSQHRRMIKEELLGKRLREEAKQEAKVATWEEVPEALRERVKAELADYEPSMDDIDKLMLDGVQIKDKNSKAMLTLIQDKEYVDAITNIAKLEKEIEEKEKWVQYTADLKGLGGHMDNSEAEGEEDSLHSAQVFQKENQKEISRLRSQLQEHYDLMREKHKAGTETGKALKTLQDAIKDNKLNEIKINIEYDDNETRSLIRDSREVWATSKQHKVLGMLKTLSTYDPQNKIQLTDNQRLKLDYVNETLEYNDFHDMKSLYNHTIVYDWVCDYIDNGTVKPIAMKTWQQDHTKAFFNELRAKGLILRQFVEREKGNSTIHYFPNFLSMTSEAEFNLMLKYNGISKARVSKILNHQNLRYVDSIVGSQKEKQPLAFEALSALTSGKLGNISDREAKRIKADARKLSKDKIFDTMYSIHEKNFKKLKYELEEFKRKASETTDARMKENYQKVYEDRYDEYKRLTNIAGNKAEFAFLANIVQNPNRYTTVSNALNLFKLTEIFRPSEAIKEGVKATGAKKIIAEVQKPKVKPEAHEAMSEMDEKALEWAKEFGYV